ncbi:MAG: FAD-dependent oxidoreductase [Emcibacteraceae bacterium]|nr:FAD-dependent oxidoreductase [Emcibacteraceae bacterium]MDG1858826.1 FAD-dependent oxidoreductase [Emcibacteraceae bacterium]
MTEKVDILIVGAGQAGAQVAISLRQGGYLGSIMLVGDEKDAPYERPPLSKDYLSGDKEKERLSLRKTDFWSGRDIDLKTNMRISSIDSDKQTAATSSGEVIHYQELIWAAGGQARTIPDYNKYEGVHVIRTIEDVDCLRDELVSATSVTIIGGGYIGLEAAAVLTKQNKKVTLVEAQDRVLERVAAAPISHFFQDEHTKNGVDIRTNISVARIESDNNRINKVILADGFEIETDIIIVGIGLQPNQQIIEKAGGQCGNGVIVDEFCRTSLPHVFAIGDCACHPNIYAQDQLVRIESVSNAIDQAKTVASVILEDKKPYRALPWFWSNQYDLKLQTAGLNHGFDETVLRGKPETRSFSLIYLREGQIIAVDAVNSVKDFMAGKKLVEQKVCPDVQSLADIDIPLKSLL